MKTLNDFVVSGKINTNAPVIAVSEYIIHADCEIVWELLTDIDRWPMWVRSITAAKLEGGLMPSSGFRWKRNGIWIRSTLQLVEPKTRLAWSGKAAGMTAIHTWEIRDHENGGTIVKTSDSIEGFIAKWLMSPAKLERSLNDWLEDLKRAAESE